MNFLRAAAAHTYRASGLSNVVDGAAQIRNNSSHGGTWAGIAAGSVRAATGAATAAAYGTFGLPAAALAGAVNWATSRSEGPPILDHTYRSPRQRGAYHRDPAPAHNEVRVMTWNTQGEKASHVMDSMYQTRSQVALIQESGRITPGSEFHHPGVSGQTLAQSRDGRFSVHDYVGPDGGHQTFYRWLTINDSKPLATWSTEPIDGRQMMFGGRATAREHQVSTTHGLTVSNTHAPSDRGHGASRDAQMAAFARIGAGVDIAGGDWNRLPPGVGAHPHVTTLSSGRATHQGGNELDYFGATPVPAGSPAHSPARRRRVPQSDHDQVVAGFRKR